MDIQIRPIQLADIESYRQAVGSVGRERKYLTTTDSFSLEQSTQFVSNNITNNYAQYVAVLGDEVVGWADIIPQQRETTRHIGGLGIGILEPYRGQGIGDRLLCAVIQHAWDSRLTRLQLDVYADNHRAIALYKKHGYQHEGTKRYASLIDGEYRDIHVMAQYRV